MHQIVIGSAFLKISAVEGKDLLYYKFKLLIAALIVLGLQTSCVTTTTSGFNVDASEEQAVPDYIQLALAYYEAGDLGGARRHINNALAHSDSYADTYNLLALVSQREGDLELAEENFRKALRSDRTNFRARNNYAALLFDQQRYEDAYTELQLVANDTGYDGRAIAFENLGRSAERLGRQLDAENAFTRALQLNANLFVSALELSMLNLKKRGRYGCPAEFPAVSDDCRLLLDSAYPSRIAGRDSDRQSIK